MKCEISGAQIESWMASSSESATGATAGGTSASMAEPKAGSTEGAAPASSAKASANAESIVIDGWVCSDANPFLHGLARSVSAPDGDWPIVLVLTAGDGESESTPSIAVPPAVLRWLLTGER